MSLIVKDSGDFELPPAGNWIGRCYGMIDLGHQYQPRWEKSTAQIVMLVELLDDDTRHKDGSPMTVNKIYTASLSEKAHLRSDMESWRGKRFTAEELAGFNVSKVCGQYGLFNVVHSEDGKWANILGITRVPKQMKGAEPDPVNKILTFDLIAPDAREQMDALPKWIQEKIKKSAEWTQDFAGNAGSEDPAAGMDDFDDSDLPF